MKKDKILIEPELLMQILGIEDVTRGLRKDFSFIQYNGLRTVMNEYDFIKTLRNYISKGLLPYYGLTKVQINMKYENERVGVIVKANYGSCTTPEKVCSYTSKKSELKVLIKFIEKFFGSLEINNNVY